MNKNLLYALLFLGLGGYYGYDTIYPEYAGWEIKITELQEDLDQAKRTAPRLAEMQMEEKKIKEKLRKSLTRLPSAEDLDNLLDLVMPLLAKEGIQPSQIGSKSVGAPVEKEVYRIHAMRIANIKDVSLPTIVKVLYQLRNYGRIINVVNFNFVKSPTKGKGNEDLYTLNLNIETYSYISDEEGEE